MCANLVLNLISAVYFIEIRLQFGYLLKFLSLLIVTLLAALGIQKLLDN